VGELPVLGHHRIDVGGVEQGDALGHALVRRQHEQPVAARPGEPLLTYPGHGGEEDILREPVDVVGVTGEHRAVRRRAPDAGHADLYPDDAVDQGRFTRPGRADQSDQDRGARFAQPRQQVVVDLAEQLAPLRAGLLGSGGLQRQLGGDDRLAQREDRGLDQLGVHTDRWLGRRTGAARGAVAAAGAGTAPGVVAVPGAIAAAGAGASPADRGDARGGGRGPGGWRRGDPVITAGRGRQARGSRDARPRLLSVRRRGSHALTFGHRPFRYPALALPAARDPPATPQ
jgi:hypothetical protein